MGARRRNTLPEDYYERVACAPVEDADDASRPPPSSAETSSRAQDPLPSDYFESLEGAGGGDAAKTGRGKRRRSAAAARPPSRREATAGERVTTTIRLSRALRDRARDFAHTGAHPSGKSLSALVEHLLARELESYAALTPPAGE